MYSEYLANGKFNLELFITTNSFGNEVAVEVKQGEIVLVQFSYGSFNSDSTYVIPLKNLDLDQTYTLLFLDSYGDGWDGGFAEVRINGETVMTEYPSGYGGQITISPDCECYVDCQTWSCVNPGFTGMEPAFASTRTFDMSIEIHTKGWGGRNFA